MHEPPATFDPFASDRYFLKQHVRLMVNQYEISWLGANGKSAGQPIGFVQQKRMALKEDLRCYTDSSKTTELFRIKAQAVWDPNARYDVVAGDGSMIGQLKKEFGSSLLRSKWKLFDASGAEVAWAEEKSMAVALFRRFAGFIPFVGGLLELIPLQFHFVYYQGQQQIGEHRSIFGPRDKYVLDMSADTAHVLDRRLAVALAVGLDALQAR